MDTIPFVFQYPFAVLQRDGFALRGNWASEFFGNNNPIVVELGCGKGEYTVGLARRYPDRNYIGIDIKGARMWSGATQARDLGLTNVAFLRTDIELLPHFFAPGEVSELWITFPDPQMKKTRKRLTSTRFMELYRQVLPHLGAINLKSDSPFLYTYTRLMTALNHMPVEIDIPDLYHPNADTSSLPDGLLQIHTHYEQQWLDRGLSIKYHRWRLPAQGQLQEPTDEIPRDTYRSYSRGQVQCPDQAPPLQNP